MNDPPANPLAAGSRPRPATARKERGARGLPDQAVREYDSTAEGARLAGDDGLITRARDGAAVPGALDRKD